MIHRLFSSFAAILLLAQALSEPAASQTRPNTQGYARDLVELSDTLGAAHGIRNLCNGEADQYWRTRMIDLLSLEAPTQSRLRASMVAAFNDGFTRSTGRYQTCSTDAVAAETRYAADGRAISDRLAEAWMPQRPDARR